jgi:hypothetical protein
MKYFDRIDIFSSIPVSLNFDKQTRMSSSCGQLSSILTFGLVVYYTAIKVISIIQDQKMNS